MKNIHVFPTSNPSRLFIDIDDNKLKITQPIGGEHMMNQHIYITNDDEIKVGDWFLTPTNDLRCANIEWRITISQFIPKTDFKKIILTTDQDLIADGIQSIPDEFLEWFVKNPSFDSVKVLFSFMSYQLNKPASKIYKIIIPKTTQEIINEDFAGGLDMGQIITQEEPKQDFYKIGDFDKHCDDGCKYHCTKGNTQLAECLKEPKSFKHKCEVLSKEYIMSNRSNAYDFIDFDKQEIIRKVAERILANNIDGLRDALKDDDLFFFYKDVIMLYGEAMAKYQKEKNKNMYSKKNIINALHSVELKDNKNYSKIYEGIIEYLDKIKNK